MSFVDGLFLNLFFLLLIDGGGWYKKQMTQNIKNVFLQIKEIQSLCEEFQKVHDEQVSEFEDFIHNSRWKMEQNQQRVSSIKEAMEVAKKELFEYGNVLNENFASHKKALLSQKEHFESEFNKQEERIKVYEDRMKTYEEKSLDLEDKLSKLKISSSLPNFSLAVPSGNNSPMISMGAPNGAVFMHPKNALIAHAQKRGNKLPTEYFVGTGQGQDSRFRCTVSYLDNGVVGIGTDKSKALFDAYCKLYQRFVSPDISQMSSNIPVTTPTPGVGP